MAIVVVREIRLRWHHVRGGRQVVCHHLIVSGGTERIIHHAVGVDRLVSVELGLLLISLGLGVALD